MQHTTRHILMVRPRCFASNPQTHASNHFQQAKADTNEAQAQAAIEFDRYAAALANAGVNVMVIEDRPNSISPDAIFPNNWISLHQDGRVFLYPMEAPNRRLERRPAILAALRQHFAISSINDLSPIEEQSRYLEGTGAMVFDHTSRVAYACLSSRCDKSVLTGFLQQLGYQAASFQAIDRHGHPIYHTNVMMAVGTQLAVICREAIHDRQQQDQLLTRLAASGKALIDISYNQMENFCGNIIELQNQAGQPVFAMSTRAWTHFTPAQQSVLQQHGQIVHSPLDTIETLGGGGARCMVAENFLPLITA